MNSTLIDLAPLARDLQLPLVAIERTVALLDEGNTVPFITRYRKDETKGLDEEQIRAIQFRVGKQRMLEDRKQTILKSIEAQGKLTEELSALIGSAQTLKRLEDLYLPFKPKKQSLATIARERGLEALAREIFEANPAAADLRARAEAFFAPEKDVNTVDDVLLGVGHLLAERISEDAELRGRLRRIFERSGRLACTKVETPPPALATAPNSAAEEAASGGEATDGDPGHEAAPTDETAGEELAAEQPQANQELQSPPVAETEGEIAVATDTENPSPEQQSNGSAGETESDQSQSDEQSAADELPAAETPAAAPDEVVAAATEAAHSTEPTEPSTEPLLPTGRLFEKPAEPIRVPDTKKKKKKKKKKVVGEHAFKDFYDFQEPLGKVPPHRILAINRGERARAIRVRIEADFEAMFREAEHLMVPQDHPHADFLRGCVRDALTRLTLPSLERELRRELTDWAEDHAVEVFVRNLRRLLLQQPVRGKRVLAIDPGFKSGCKMAALDEFGNVLGHGVVFVIGKNDRREKARQRLADMAKLHNVSVIAIGNGTGCREAEQLVAETLAEELKDSEIGYVVVNEAGASIYSTSPLGREELPQFDALQRGAISLGRRLLDPLSEMVKINPANLGVGLYQHDMKARNLKDSLDAVVESCVNFVGVDVNSASPALLRYVSGMNALTARRIYEYRREHGPFQNREQLKQVPGVGDATFVQAAGFLKVIGGENPLDATWIHPESYDIAQRVLEKIGSSVSELARAVPAPAPKPEPVPFGLLPEEPQSAAAESLSESADSLPAIEQVEALLPVDEPTKSFGSEATEGLVTSVAASELSPAEEAGSTAPPPADALAGGAASPLPATDPVAIPQTETIAAQQHNEVAEKAAGAHVDKLAAELQVGTLLVEDILNSLSRPLLDPRDHLSAPLFRRGIMKLEDLQPGMEMQGTVLNVVDFGVFLDIGLSDSGLVHISRLADRFIRDPHEVVGVGDVLKVWVVEVDRSRRRVSLTAIAPGSEKPQRPAREQRPQQQPRPPRDRAPQGQGQGQGQAQGDRRPAGNRPQGDRPQGNRPPQGDRRPQGGGRRDQRSTGPATPKVIERKPTKPKVEKPISKAMQDGKAPMRSFGDLLQFMDKKKESPGDEK